MPDLVPIEIDDTGGDQHSNAPIEAQNRVHLLKGGLLFDRNLDDEVEHRIACATWLDDLPQAGSQRLPRLSTNDDDLRQCHLNRLLSPIACPRSLLIGSTQSKRERLLIQIKTQTVGLAHPMPIVASIGQHPCFEHRSTLHCFIGVRETAVVEIKITCLFDQALQFNRLSSIRIGLAHIGERLLDNLAVLTCPFGFRLRLDHSLFKERDNQGELLLALRLPTKNPSRLLCLAAPLAGRSSPPLVCRHSCSCVWQTRQADPTRR